MTANPKLRLPYTLEEITPAWLTEALAPRFPGIRIASVVRDAERAGTSTSARLTLNFADGGRPQGAPETIYIKGGFDDVMRRRVWSALIMEARFYAEFAPELPLHLSQTYFSGFDDEARQGIIILEDLTRRGVHFGHATDDVSVERAAAIVEGLGKLHARFWGDSRLLPYRNWAEPQRAFLRYLFRPRHWAVVSERHYAKSVGLRHILPDPGFGLRALETMWAIDDAHVPVLLHGDCHGGNMFFEVDGTPGFLDWQCTFPGAPAHDLGEMLITNLTTADRRAHERELIAHYRDVLVKSGVHNAPSVEALFFAYRQNIMHNMASAVFNPYDMQSEQVTTITATRTLNAALDLDMIGALGLR